jgi:triacylglycerol lipase
VGVKGRRSSYTLNQVDRINHSEPALNHHGASNGELRPLVLTPGYQDTTRKLARLAAYLRGQGLCVLVLSPQPSNGKVGIDALAQQLAAQIDAALGPERPFDFFGFSMGGLIGRYYLQRLGGTGRIRRMVTLATPHLGTWSAYGAPARPAIRQMRPGSDFLAALNEQPEALDQVAFSALWTPFDLSVTPAHHGYLPGRPAQRIWSPFHGLLVHDPRVIRAVADYYLPPVRR